MSFIKSLKADFPASVVVFLVALPLCLGIASVSEAPLLSGIIAGIVGGIVVGSFSASRVGVSGPAAGLAVIVLSSIQELGSFNTFLVAVVLSGIIQLVLGFARAGFIAYYFPSSVIKGMLSGIGIIIIIKQIPSALGYERKAEEVIASSETFLDKFSYFTPGAIVITVTSLAILLLWESSIIKNNKKLSIVPGSLVAVVVSVILAKLFPAGSYLSLNLSQLVSIPVPDSTTHFFQNFAFPDFSQLGNTKIYTVAITMAIVASLETLLCVEATDKLDPHKVVTPTNRELKAQGIGNIVSGLIGGLPITQVIVRSSANIQAGAASKMSAVIHGLLLLLSAMFLSQLVNLIPLSCLASILLLVGYKLAKPGLFKEMYSLGKVQFTPFAATIIGIVFTDLLVGIGIGMLVAIMNILYLNFRAPFFFDLDKYKDGNVIVIELSEHVTFFNKASILTTLSRLPANSNVVIDASNSLEIDYDVWEIIEDFESVVAVEKNITVSHKGGDLKDRLNKTINHLSLQEPSSLLKNA